MLLHHQGKRIGELGTTLAVTINRSTLLVTLMMEAIRSSETLVLIRATPRHIPEDGILHVTIIFLHVDQYM
jgi:hypothetical protein